MPKSEKKFDPFNEIEKRLNKTEERLLKIEKKTKKSFADMQKYVVLEGTINRRLTYSITNLMFLLQLSEGNTSSFDDLVESIVRLESDIERIKKLSKEIPPIMPSAAFSLILVMSKRWEIPFEQIASYLIRKLGKKYARRLVRKEAIMEYFGSEALSTWEALFRE